MFNFKKKTTEEQREDFVEAIDKLIKKEFKVKKDLECTVVLAGTKEKSIAVGAGDQDICVSLLSSFCKKMTKDQACAVCSMVMADMDVDDCLRILKVRDTITTREKLQKGKKKILH